MDNGLGGDGEYQPSKGGAGDRLAESRAAGRAGRLLPARLGSARLYFKSHRSGQEQSVEHPQRSNNSLCIKSSPLLVCTLHDLADSPRPSRRSEKNQSAERLQDPAKARGDQELRRTNETATAGAPTNEKPANRGRCL